MKMLMKVLVILFPPIIPQGMKERERAKFGRCEGEQSERSPC